MSWSYKGNTGPEHWGDICSHYRLAKEGKEQSPIDLKNDVESGPVSDLKFDYKNFQLEILNTGQTIQVNCPLGSSIAIRGERYHLDQFHFHVPSEHTIEGESFSLEAHLVHKNENGDLAVVGVFLNEGQSSDLIASLWEHLPKAEGVKNSISTIKINPVNLLPNDKSYYSYKGSLTTPPCTEGVQWIVMKEALEISKEQLVQFTELYQMNARPIQPLNERIVKFMC